MPFYLEQLQDGIQATSCTVNYGPMGGHKITLNIEPAGGKISVLEISYNQAPGLLNFNQNQQEGVFEEETTPADWVSTIPNPWVVTVGSHRTIITCFDLNNFPSGTPLCSYTPIFAPFIDSARFIDWNGNIIDCDINYRVHDIESGHSNKFQIYNPKLHGLDFNGTIAEDSRSVVDSITEIGKDIINNERIIYSSKLPKTGIRFDNSTLFNKLKTIEKSKMKKIKRSNKQLDTFKVNYVKSSKPGVDGTSSGGGGGGGY